MGTPTGIIITGMMSQPDILITNVSKCFSELGMMQFQIYVRRVEQNLVYWMVCYRKNDGENVERFSRDRQVLGKYQSLKNVEYHSFSSEQKSREFYNKYRGDSPYLESYTVNNGKVTQTQAAPTEPFTWGLFGGWIFAKKI